MNNKKKRKLLIIFLSIILLIIFLVFSFCIYIYKNAPEFNIDLLYHAESTNIYDNNNELITTIGTEKRNLVRFDELPEVLIDAIIATEDARFYTHKGIDIKRFLKASLEQLFNIDAGGASTLEMQLSKNTYTNTNSKGIEGIIRKFTDIYISVFKLDKKYSKNEILEYYVNSPFLGSGSYGVKMAAKTYFNKDIRDLNLVEASLIAGLFQAPSAYDPFNNPEKANERKNEVLNLMLRHGYISEEEANTAKNVNIENYLTSNYSISPYQGFIDTVIEEVKQRTNLNPYEVSMDIYTTMDRNKQNVINNFYNEYGFKDEKVEVGISVINNDNGEILAVGAGRNKNGELTFNYATEIKRHPGSTAKPLFDYGPGIEYNGWSSVTLFNDSPISYTNGGVMRNIDNRYLGTLTLRECLVKSRNPCALQAFKRVKNSNINEFVKSLGITPEYLYDDEYINEAHSIGAFTGVSTLDLASAYQAFANGGIYNEPHSYTKIVYKNNLGNIEENLSYDSHRAMKETTAYIISDVLKGVTSSKTKINDTDIATKTGTSSYDNQMLKNLGLTTEIIKDSWTVTFTKSNTIAIWYGYDKFYTDYYLTNNESFDDRINIQSYIVKNIVNEGEKFIKPNGLITVKQNITSSDGTIKTYTGLKAK